MARTTAIFARDLDRLGKDVRITTLLVRISSCFHGNFPSQLVLLGKISSQHEVPTCCSGTPLELGCLQDMCTLELAIMTDKCTS